MQRAWRIPEEMRSAAITCGRALGAREEHGFERLLAQLTLYFFAALNTCPALPLTTWSHAATTICCGHITCASLLLLTIFSPARPHSRTRFTLTAAFGSPRIESSDRDPVCGTTLGRSIWRCGTETKSNGRTRRWQLTAAPDLAIPDPGIPGDVPSSFTVCCRSILRTLPLCVGCMFHPGPTPGQGWGRNMR